jgi:hypothetical protein
MVALITGGFGGLLRIGWLIEGVPQNAVAFHGALMAAGFFGTLIALERAVALRAPWGYAAPFLSGAGALLLIDQADWRFGGTLLLLGSAGFLATSLVVLRRQRVAFTGLLALGAGCLVAGNALWFAGRPVPEVALWWMSFLVLTIAGERLELTRLVRIPSLSRSFFTLTAALLPIANALSLLAPAAGRAVAGVLVLILACWAAINDVARRTIRQRGLPRFAAVCMLAAYAWLATAGVLLLCGNFDPGRSYDAILHATFLGFAFSMVLGHAPIIFPAVLRAAIPYGRVFYLPLAILHSSVLLRVAADLLSSADGRRWGGLGNAVAVSAFLLIVLGSALSARWAGRFRRALTHAGV